MPLNVISDNISENLRYVEKDPHTRSNNHHVRTFRLEQYCPIADSWCQMLLPGSWILRFESENEIPVPDKKCIIKEETIERLNNLPKAIVIAREKHYTRYFDGSSTEAIGQVSIHLIKERKENGFYPEFKEPTEKIKEPIFKTIHFEDDPEHARLAERQWKEYRSKLTRQKELKDFQNLLDQAVNELDYYSAYLILSGRNDYEYEGFEIELLIEAKI